MSQFRQASAIIRGAWQRNLNYRTTIVAFRIGEMAEMIVLVLMWSAIYASGTNAIRGFSENEMITYVLAGSIFAVITRTFISSMVSRDIDEGRLSMFLVKPISYVKFIFLNELGRVALTTLMSLGSCIMITAFFLGRFVINTDLRYIGVLVVMLLFAFILDLMIGFLVGSIAFWADETDGIQTSVDRVKRFFSGGYFPLSLLPSTLAVITSYLPFAYSFYIPAMLYLRKIDLLQGVQGLLIQLCWIAVLAIVISIVWKRGLKRYEATGA